MCYPPVDRHLGVLYCADMTMSDEDQAAVNAHIKSLPGGRLVCPICHGTKWGLGGADGGRVGGLARLYVFHTRSGVESNVGENIAIVPALVLSCTGCHFLCHFLWDRIARGTSVGQGPVLSQADRDFLAGR